MTERVVVGTRPWLGEPLADWRWLTEPVPAERLAALRIGTALVLLADLILTYWPFRYDYLGPGSLAEPDVFGEFVRSPYWAWSLLHRFPGVFTPDVTLGLWTAAAVCLLVGIAPRLAALVAWALAVSVNLTNPYLHNSGDLIRQHLLFFLMLTPCGAAWALQRPAGVPRGAKAAVYPWALRLLFVELVVLYFFNGVYKLALSDRWRSGDVMHYVLHTPGWSRWSPPFDVPIWFSAGLTYFVLAWELAFPVLVLTRRWRVPALAVGAAFHVVTFFQLEIGPFGLYALCLYLPLVPWEGRRPRAPAARRAATPQPASEPLACALA
jgi:hypothetical protein